jgi:hypothetical protein
MMKKRRVWVLGGWVIFGALIAVAVASAEDKRREDALRERASAYWEAWRVNDLHTVYQMETAMVEGLLTPDQMQQARFQRLRVVGYKFKDVQIHGDSAEMVVETELTLPDLQGKSFTGPPKKDHWTFVNGNWYHGKSSKTADGAKATAPVEGKKP